MTERAEHDGLYGVHEEDFMEIIQRHMWRSLWFVISSVLLWAAGSATTMKKRLFSVAGSFFVIAWFSAFVKSPLFILLSISYAFFHVSVQR